MEWKRGLPLAIIAVLGPAGSALAQTDFTFNVPVEVRSLVPEAEPFIDCWVKPDAQSSTQIGRGRTEFQPDANGDFSGTVVVSFDAEAGEDRSEATYYGCGVWSYVPGTGRGSYCTIGGIAQQDVCRPDPDAEKVNPVMGQIP